MPTQAAPGCNSTLITETRSFSNHTDNETQSGTARDEVIITIVTFISTPVLILGLISNGAIFRFLCCCGIKRNTYTVYILNLAIADFTVLISYTIYIVFSMIIWGELTFENYLYPVIDILALFGYNTSFFLLTVISIERCLGAFYPFWYHSNRPEHLSAILCALLWLFSCVVTGVEYFTCWQAYFSSEEPCYRKHAIANLFLLTIFVIFIPIIVLCSLSLLVKVWRRSSARLSLTIVITVVLFLIFALPLRISAFVVYWHPEKELNGAFFNISCILNVINGSINPFVYFLVGRRKQQRSQETFSAVFHRSWKDETEEVVAQQTQVQ
ncbi:proto-oncogene Mas-like [Lacerta agilis]|uniref:proto-oncogene Mas-like n=1 Tax=Lacerta agilis TaxID=80427 RepID=UPI001419E484|nr:proto-oncogene Mas-like [Lacerta agilis]